MTVRNGDNSLNFVPTRSVEDLCATDQEDGGFSSEDLPAKEDLPPPPGPCLDLETLSRIFFRRTNSEAISVSSRENDESAFPRIPGYMLSKEIGRGGMGAVYAATETVLGRVVAIKVIRQEFLASGDLARRFHREAEAGARLEHPNIVRIYRIDATADKPYIVQELADAGSLAERLQQGPLLQSVACQWMSDLAGAIDFAHRQGIVHRDLKPSNILLKTSTMTGEQIPLVCDFGLAKDVSDQFEHTASGTSLLGTPAYMAPEQTAGSPTMAPTVDVYGLGATLYAMLVGRPPFQASNLLDLLEKIRKEEPIAPRALQPGLSKDLDTICLKCLEKEPARRYQSARALLDDLHRLMAGEPIAARPNSTIYRIVKWSRRRPASAALLAVCALATIGLIAGSAIHVKRLNQAIERANQNERLARQEGERSLQQYKDARRAIDGMLKELRRPGTVDIPQVRDLQRRQWEQALTFYLSLLSQSDFDSVQVQRDTVKALAQAAEIQAQLGRTQESLSNYSRARKILETLIAGGSADKEIRMSLAQVIRADADLRGLPVGGIPLEEYEKEIQPSIRIYEQLLADDPQQRDVTLELAQAWGSLGIVHRQQSTIKAEGYYRKSIDALQSVQPPFTPAEARALAKARINLGLLLIQQNRGSEADEQYQNLQSLLLPLIPNDADAVALLGAAFSNWAMAASFRQNPELAMSRASQAVEWLRPLQKREPDVPAYRDYLYNALGERSNAAGALKQYSRRIADLHEMMVLKPAWAQTTRYFLIRTLTDSRDFYAAMKEIDEVAVADPPFRTSEECVHLLACLTELISGSDFEKLTQGERKERKEKCLKSTLALLQHAKLTLKPEQWQSIRRDVSSVAELKGFVHLPEFREYF